MNSRILPFIAAAGLAGLVTSHPVAAAQITPTPRATPLPITVTNRPFLGAQSAAQPVDLATRGYVEEEYLVSGSANVYEWRPAGTRPAVRVRTPNVPYATRILVRRPADPRRASGRVIVELLDPGHNYDRAPLWGLSWQYFVRQGDIWVGVTIKPVAAEALHRFDEVRYAGLSLASAQPADCNGSAAARSMPYPFARGADLPSAENGLAWDITAQVGALLRSSSKENPLIGVDVRRLIAAGYAEAGGYVVTYVNALHDEQRLGNERPVYDGYMDAAGAMLPAPINQCAAPLAPQDPRLRVGPRDAPVLTVMTQSDFGLALLARRADSDDPADYYRLYEVAGSAHSGPFPAGEPLPGDLTIAGIIDHDATDSCEGMQSTFPLNFAFDAIWAQFDDYLVRGVAMQHAVPISIDETGQLHPDAKGNAIGGLRLPQLAVPLAVYNGRSKALRSEPRVEFLCSLTGSMRRFDSAEVKALYGRRAEFIKRFNAAVDQAVAERWLEAADAAATKSEAARTAPAF